MCLAVLSLSCHNDPPGRATPNPAPAVRVPPVAARDAASATPPSNVEPPAAAASFHGTGQFLPQGVVAEVWRQSGAVRYAAGQELFQLIDGAGEMYLRYGFREFARSEYRKAGTSQVVTVEIYDMGSPLGAFGQFSMLLSNERDPATMQANATNHGAGGFLGGSQLVFWKGHYLAQVNFMDEDSDDETALAAQARVALPLIANAVAGALPADPAPSPAPPSNLPSAGLVWGGTTYLAENALGLGTTGPAWIGHYRAPSGARYRLGVLAVRTEAEARAATARFHTAQAASIPGLGDEAFSVSREQGEVTFVRRGAAVWVLADALPAVPPPLSHADRISTLRAAIAPLPAAGH